MEELLNLKHLLDWLEEHQVMIKAPLDRNNEGNAQLYANACIKAISYTKHYLERYPDRVEFRTWLADQMYNPDLVKVIENACSLTSVQSVTKLLQRLRKAHEFYDQAGDNTNLKQAVYLKAKPIIEELGRYGVDEPYCTLLLVYGGHFLTYELKQPKDIEQQARQEALSFTS